MEIVTFFYPNILRIWDNPEFGCGMNIAKRQMAEFPMI